MDNSLLTKERIINVFNIPFIDEQINRATKANDLIGKEI